MTAEERFEATEPYMEEFKEKRIQRKTAPHNVPIAVFNDASGTIQSLVNEVSMQHSVTIDDLADIWPGQSPSQSHRYRGTVDRRPQ